MDVEDRDAEDVGPQDALRVAEVGRKEVRKFLGNEQLALRIGPEAKGPFRIPFTEGVNASTQMGVEVSVFPGVVDNFREVRRIKLRLAKAKSLDS